MNCHMITTLGIKNVNPEVLQTHTKGFRHIVQGVIRPKLGFEQDCVTISIANDEFSKIRLWWLQITLRPNGYT